MSITSESQAKNYFQSTADEQLQFVDRSQLLAWKHGAGIAYRAQVAEVLDCFRGKELPPFIAIMLILSATRETWPLQDSLKKKLRNEMSGGDADEILNETWECLNKIHSIKSGIRDSTNGKSELFAYIFRAIVQKTNKLSLIHI